MLYPSDHADFRAMHGFQVTVEKISTNCSQNRTILEIFLEKPATQSSFAAMLAQMEVLLDWCAGNWFKKHPRFT